MQPASGLPSLHCSRSQLLYNGFGTSKSSAATCGAGTETTRQMGEAGRRWPLGSLQAQYRLGASGTDVAAGACQRFLLVTVPHRCMTSRARACPACSRRCLDAARPCTALKPCELVFTQFIFLAVAAAYGVTSAKLCKIWRMSAAMVRDPNRRSRAPASRCRRGFAHVCEPWPIFP